MNYTTVVAELFSRFPEFETKYHSDFAYLGDEESWRYIIFGSILIPTLENALEESDLKMILRISAFLEDASIAARHDRSLSNLLKVEVARWLGWAQNEDRLAPWLGKETKQLCNYVPGLATQRLQLRAKRKQTRLALVFEQSSIF